MVKELQQKFIKNTMLVVTVLLVIFLVVLNVVNYFLSRRDSLSALDRILARSEVQVPGDRDGGILPDSLKPGEAPELSSPDTLDGLPGFYFVARVNPEGAVVFSDLTHSGGLLADDMIALLQKADDGFDVKVTGETESEYPGLAPAEGMAGPSEMPGSAQDRAGDRRETVAGEPVSGDATSGEAVSGEAPSGEAAHEVPASEDVVKKRLQEDTWKRVTGTAGDYLFRAAEDTDGSVTYAFLNVSRERDSLLRILLVTIAVGVCAWLLILLLVVYMSRRAIAPIAENIQRQRRFITDAGHELKTPLAVILTNVDAQELHEGKTKWLANIRSQALRLSDLTKQMLLLSKMDESGADAFVSTTFDASQLLEDTVRLFQESAFLRGIRIRTEIEPAVQISFSRERFQQMAELLLDNAVKYGKENGTLSVSLVSTRKSVRMSFRNDCEELPDIDPDRLFDRFYRADTSRSRNTGGSGIGLAVVRAVAEHNGGKAHAIFHPDNSIEFLIELQAA